jgi:hypothetical protein
LPAPSHRYRYVKDGAEAVAAAAILVFLAKHRLQRLCTNRGIVAIADRL